MRCLDTTTLVRFLAGSLAPQARAAIETHLAACDLCAQVACCGAARLGRYRLLEQLGRGGSAGVFAAFDVDLERRVALKVTALAPGRARELRARAVREGRALARVCHPNVVTVHEIGASGPYVYLVLELVAGLDVRAWRCAAPRAWSEVRDVFMDVGRGLAAVHDAGLVHGDVKAANVIVAGDGSPAKLLDLGLVTAASEPAGVLAGTPGYLAPERLRGAPADALTDQFAYCATLWEALFGALPPATAHGGAPAAEVPAALRAIALRGLARDRDARFADLGELVAALTSVGDARSTPRPPPAPRARAATARRRPPRRGTRPGA